MRFKLGRLPVRLFATAAVISGVTLSVASGCGGGSSGSGSPSGGSGGGNGGTGGATGKAGSGGKAGSRNTGGEAGVTGEGGEAGALPPAQNTSSGTFVSGAVTSSSKNFKLISNTGESLGGTVGSKQSKSAQYTYVPGVVAATSH